MPNLLDYTDKVVLITGGATGIGQATAKAFAGQGAKVVIGDVNEGATETVAQIKRAGGEALFVRTDVSDPASVEALVKATVDTYGRLDCAFNNAGILPTATPLAEMSVADFDKVISIDLRGVFLCLKYQISHMLTAGGGSIVNTASVAGLIAGRNTSSYVAAKHGVIGLTKAAALDYATQGIRVNAIAPGLVATAMTQGWLEDAEFSQRLLQTIPLARPAEPEEMSGMVLFLNSSQASFITGQTFTVDGGQVPR
ncbi:SDR family NAD(P)-dependent oxidoreductase [Paraburkholderia sp. 40]|uniref:SDR family NAD(P)-dependent oxidoreductase n=1 Tax=Paraburkholderia sp. 40 TaxID=2991059 RepID=UPI003D21F208